MHSDSPAWTEAAESDFNAQSENRGSPRDTRNQQSEPDASKRSRRTEKRSSLWGWSYAEMSANSPSRSRARTSGRLSPVSLQNYIPQSSALFPGHPCSPRRDSHGDLDGITVPRSAGNYTSKLVRPSDHPRSNYQILHNIPHLSEDEPVLRYTMAVARQHSSWPLKRGRLTASSKPRAGTSTSLDSDWCDADTSVRSTTSAGGQLLEHTFASRKKRCGTGPLIKNSVERQYLLSRSTTAEPELNLDEAPDKWMKRQEARAARRQAAEWDRILRYTDPKPHGGKRVMFQSALRNVIGPRMEIKLRTYDELKFNELMEASQIFVPPRCVCLVPLVSCALCRVCFALLRSVGAAGLLLLGGLKRESSEALHLQSRK